MLLYKAIEMNIVYNCLFTIYNYVMATTNIYLNFKNQTEAAFNFYRH